MPAVVINGKNLYVRGWRSLNRSFEIKEKSTTAPKEQEEV
jgi:hypothetical protein